MRDPLQRRAPRPRPTGPTGTARRSSPARHCDEQRLRDCPALAFVPASGGSFPAAYDGRPVLRRLLASVHLGRCSADLNGLPDPSTRAAVRAAGRIPGRSRVRARMAISSTRTSRGERDPADPLHRQPGQRSPDRRRVRRTHSRAACRSTVDFDGSGSSDPDAGDALTYAWDLDDDGQLDDSAAVGPSFTYTTAGVYTVTLRVTDTSGAFDEDTVTIDAGSGPPVPTIDDARGGHDLARRPDDRLLGIGDRPRGRRPARHRARLVADPAPLHHAEQLPPAHDPELRGHGKRVLRRPRPRVPLAPRAEADGHRLGRQRGHDVAAARSARRSMSRRRPTRRG